MTLRRWWPRAAAALGLAAMVAGLAAAPGATQVDGADERLIIRRLDTTEFPEVSMTLLATGVQPRPADFVLRENDRILPDLRVVPIGDTAQRVGISVVVDTSGSMRDNDAMTLAVDAIRQFARDRRPNEEIAVVSFAFEPELRTGFTNDGPRIEAAVDQLVAGGGTALWDGVRFGIGLFEQRTDLQRNLIVLSDGGDTHSSATFAQAQAAALDGNTTVFVVGLVTDDFDEAPLRRLAERTGGLYTATTDPEGLSQLYNAIQETIQNQFEIRFRSRATESSLEYVLTAGTARVSALTNVGSVAEGTAAQPRVIEPGQGGLLSGGLARTVALGLGFLAAVLLAFGLVSLFVRDESTLRSALRPYDAGRARGESGEEEDFGQTEELAETRIVQRAVAATGRFAESRGMLVKVEGALEKADLPLRAAEAIFFYLVGAFVVVVLLLLLVDTIALAFLGILLVVIAPPAVLSFLADRRQRKFNGQLPDTLQLLAGSLRAGFSLMQGVEAVSQEVEEPMGRELRRVLAESRLGRPLEDALDDAAERMHSADFAWAVMAIKIQREVGGNLAELLQTVSDTMLARERLRREVRALTAEGRMSAIVLGIMPIAIGTFLWFSNRAYIETLFNTGIGQVMLIGAAVLGLIGVYWMKKTIEIEV